MKKSSLKKGEGLHPETLKEALGKDWEAGSWPHLPTKPSPHVAVIAEELDSTQDQLNEGLLASLHPTAESLLLVTRHQKAGHGREGRAWFSPGEAALAFSLAIKTKKKRPPGHWSLMVGWSKARSLSSWVPFQDLDLKWPNDLLLKGKKVSGSLCSMHQVKSQTWVKIGIGVNVGNMDFPPELTELATSLHQHTERAPQREDVLVAMVDSLLEDFHGLEGDELLRHYEMASSIVRGCPISWIENQMVQHGITKGLGPSGALLCDVDGKPRSLHVSEIRSLRPREH